MVSAHPEPGQVAAAHLLTREALWGDAEVIPAGDHSLPPLGRLDMDLRGLLLLSEDGVLAKAVIGPDFNLDKEYLVRVSGQITPKALAMLRHGLRLDGRQLRPAFVTVVQGPAAPNSSSTKAAIVRSAVCATSSACRVVDLLRISIGPLSLGDLPEGRWRLLTPAERTALIGR